MKAILLVTLACLIALGSSQQLRFVNNIEGATITIYSNKLGEVTVAYQETSSWNSIPDGTISITNVLDQNGTSYTNGNPIATSFSGYSTLVAVYNETESDPTKRFTLVLFGENIPAGLEGASDNTMSWIRFMDLSTAIKSVTLASQYGTVSSFVGYLQTTAFSTIAASTPSMRVYNSETQNYNTPSLVFDTTFTTGTAYTIMFFTNKAGTHSAKIVNDHTFTPTSSGTTGSPALSLTTPSIRFVNAIEGSTLRFFSDQLSDITLPYMESTQYYGVTSGSITIQNILNQNGISYNNGNPLSTSFGHYHTLVAVMNKAESDPNKQFLLVLFNETTPANMDTANTDATKSWVRLMDFAQTGRFFTLAYQAGAIASNIGFLVNTPFVGIPATTTSLRLYDSVSGSFNNPDISLTSSLSGKNAYTVMLFSTEAGVKSAKIVTDRLAGGDGVQTTTTGAQSTTTGSDSTTGSATTTGSQQTTATQATTRAVIVNNQEGSAGKLTAFGLVTLVALALF